MPLPLLDLCYQNNPELLGASGGTVAPWRLPRGDGDNFTWKSEVSLEVLLHAQWNCGHCVVAVFCAEWKPVSFESPLLT